MPTLPSALGLVLSLVCPVVLPTLPVLDPYREPDCHWCTGNRGIEYVTRVGAAVGAAASGEVTFAGHVAGVAYVVVRAGDGSLVTHGGLSSISVARGATVVAGDEVGRAGASLHLGLRRDGMYVDPTSCASPRVGRRVARAVIFARAHR